MVQNQMNGLLLGFVHGCLCFSFVVVALMNCSSDSNVKVVGGSKVREEDLQSNRLGRY